MPEQTPRPAESAAYRQGIADAAVALRVQALRKLTPSIRDGFLSACNLVIDMRDGTGQPDYADHIAHLRSQLDGDPQRMTRHIDGTWTND